MENLGIDGKLMLAQFVNFVLFFFLFKKFIASPFFKFLNQEKKNEKEKEILLNKLKKGEDELLEKEKQIKDKAKKEANLIIQKAKTEALVVRDDIINDAKKDALEIKRVKEKEIQDEKNNMQQDVKKKIGELSLFIVSQSLKDYLDDDSKRKITSFILKNLDNIKISNEN